MLPAQTPFRLERAAEKPAAAGPELVEAPERLRYLGLRSDLLQPWPFVP